MGAKPVIGGQQINSFLNMWSGNKLIFFSFDGLPCLTKSGGAEAAGPGECGGDEGC